MEEQTNENVNPSHFSKYVEGLDILFLYLRSRAEELYRCVTCRSLVVFGTHMEKLSNHAGDGEYRGRFVLCKRASIYKVMPLERRNHS